MNHRMKKLILCTILRLMITPALIRIRSLRVSSYLYLSICFKGEVSGRLHVEVYRIVDADSDMGMNSLDAFDSPRITDLQTIGASFLGKTIKCRVRIKKASNLPTSLSHFVFCQYSFFNISETFVVAPTFDPNSVPSDQVHTPHSSNFQFEHEKVIL
uniref:C2 NT-type domain-containing protein n=1 Tax=Ascaris lumbricoides TaxID=6252 RepID=A0A0M3IVI0_ASCLU